MTSHISSDELLGRRADLDLRRATLGAMSTSDRGAKLERMAPLALGRGDELLAFATRNRVAPVVAHALLDVLPKGHAARGQAERVHDASLSRMRILLDETDAVGARLAREGIKLIALKNAGISRGVYPCAGCCPMGDVDVLVARSRFREAHALVLECGFQLASRSAVEPADLELGLESGGTEYVRHVGGEEVWLELQWRPVAGRWIRRDQEPSGDELIERSVPIDGTAVRLLAPEDNMLQVSLHTAKHSYVRAPGLRLHTDVDRLATYLPPNWDAYAALVSRLRVRTAAYFSLALAHALLDSVVPEPVLDALAPPTWKRELLVRWISAIDVFEPDERKFSRPAMIAFHSALYDDAAGFAASVLGTTPDRLGARDLPRNVRRGVRRVVDLVTRYQA